MDKNPKIIMTCLISIFAKILIVHDLRINLPYFSYIMYHLIMVISFIKIGYGPKNKEIKWRKENDDVENVLYTLIPINAIYY